MSIARPLRNVSAAVLAAAVSFAGTAQAESERFPAGPADMFRPGAAFTFYDNSTDPARVEGLNAALNTMTAQSAETAGTIAEARTGIAEGVTESSADELARAVAASIEGTFSIIVQAGFVRAMSQTDPSFARMMQTAQMKVNLPGGASVEVPILMAAAIHSLSVVAAGEKLRGDAGVPNMAGSYDLQTTGDCVVASGPVTIAQKDFVLEASGGEQLSLYGTVGTERGYLVANEQRFALIEQTEAGLPRIEVPDRPSDLFEAVIADPDGPIAFESITRGTCSFVLSPTG